MTTERMLVVLVKVTGYVSVSIGAGHVILGSRATVPGARQVSASTDSHERFLSVVFGAYGFAWLRAARRDHVDLPEVRALSVTMAAAGAGRLVSIAHRGRPHRSHLVFAGVELATPALIGVLARRVSRTVPVRPGLPARSVGLRLR